MVVDGKTKPSLDVRIAAGFRAEFLRSGPVKVTDIARDIEAMLRLEPETKEQFFDRYAYRTIYDIGIAVLSQGRPKWDEDAGEWIDEPGPWREYDPETGMHVEVGKLTPAQAKAAAEYRQKNVATELRRIEALEQIAEGKGMDAVLTQFPPSTALRNRLRGGQVQAAIDRITDGSDDISADQAEVAAWRADHAKTRDHNDDRTVKCRFCAAHIGVRFGESYSPGDDVCEKCLVEARLLMAQGVFTPKQDGRTEKCLGCGWVCHLLETDPEPGSDGPYFCGQCSKGVPRSLLKATIDPFNYALKLRTGDVIEFGYAEIVGEWVHLTTDYERHEGNNFGKHDVNRALPYRFDRGIDVRIADIVWCCDCPGGS